ncbi:hypothetical protein K501DRAFT_237959, partial [Backusella circina FSU 941]
MVKSNRSNSVSSESSVNEETHKRTKLMNSSMEFTSSSSSSNSDNKQLSPPPESNNNSNNTKTQAAFVNKLYKMLEDPQTIDLISWSSSGDLFSVSNPTAFSKSILPQYFKHNNWQSFVRQLNMYGFHKVNDLIHSNLTNESQTWEFKHPNFRKGAVGDLQHIKRKNAKTQQQLLFQQQKLKDQQQQQQQQQLQEEEFPLTPLQDVLSDDDKQNTTLIDHIIKIEDQLVGVSKTCELLFNEVVNLRMIVSKQHDAMQDLVDIVSATRPNTTCVCGNTINNDNNNSLDLQNAENLRLQVSKLKESCSSGANVNGANNNRDSPSDSSSSNGSMIPSWSPASGAVRYDNSSSINSTPSPYQGASFSSSDTKNSQRLPSFDYMQNINNNGNNNDNNGQNNNGVMETLKPMSSYYNNSSNNSSSNSSSNSSNNSSSSNNNNNNSNNKNVSFNDKSNGGNQYTYQGKSSNSSSSSPTSNDNKKNAENNNQDRSSTSFMTLGKRSHLLNPVLSDNKKEGKRPQKRKTKHHIKRDKVEEHNRN